MYCIRCGKQLKDGTQYCIYCGAPTIAVEKEKPQPADDDVSIPVDFFSNHIPAELDTDDFTIRIPNDFVKLERTPQPDETSELADTRTLFKDVPKRTQATPDAAGEIDYTRMISKDDLREAIAERWGASDDADDTRMMSKDDLREAMREQQTAQAESTPDTAGDAEFTRMMSKDDLREAMREQQTAQVEDTPDAAAGEEPESREEKPVNDIPDIPIPSDFILMEQSDEQEDLEDYDDYEENEDEEPEPLMSRRGILTVVLVVVLLFAIAVGACVLALTGGGSSDMVTGEDSTEVGFWGSGEES